jgi:hypothetical protein
MEAAVTWRAILLRLARDRYAAQLCESRDLQFATLEEHAIACGRTFVVVGGGA